MNKEELIAFASWEYKNYHLLNHKNGKQRVDAYIKAINSTRRSERRADGSNSKAKEVCVSTCGVDRLGVWCAGCDVKYDCRLYKQTD